MSRTPVSILSPHLDDAVLSCWNVLIESAAVRVVNVFSAVPPDGTLGWWDRETGASDSAERMRERLREDAEALGALGVEPVNLGFLEDQYRDGAGPTPEELLAPIAAPNGGDIVYAPAGIGGHKDHLLVRSLLGPLRERGADVRLYADLPYCTRHGWPGWVTGGEGRPEAERQWEEALDGIGLDGLEWRAVALAPNEQERKHRALITYRTQFAALGVADPAVLAFEAYREPIVSTDVP